MQVLMTPRTACRPHLHQFNRRRRAIFLVRQTLAVTGIVGVDEEALLRTLRKDPIIRQRTSLPRMMRR